jgi:sterol desaturase/sphingolipid hydroxylase (fatty acid hydroxylase superfamily)
VFFVTMLTERYLLARTGARQDARYENKDWLASLTMGVGNLVAAAIIAPVFHGTVELAYRHRIATVNVTLFTYVLLFLLEDFAYYWMHRLSHERRVWWASHVNHHSSERFNREQILFVPDTRGIV